MISYDTIRATLFKQFYEGWRDDDSDYDPSRPDSDLFAPVIYDNELEDRFVENEFESAKFPEVRDGWTPSDGWIYFSIDFGAASQTTIGEQGKRRFTRDGFITAILYTRAFGGVYNHDTLSDKVKQVFEGKRIVDGEAVVYVGAMSYTSAGSEDGIFSSVCTLPFEFDEIR